MKVTMLALAFAACATTVSAYAANPAANPATNPADAAPQHSQQWTPAQNAPQAKTRAEVRQELVRAQNDGQLAALNKLYQGS
jgi:flagellar basal body L-ring protein FlgH